MYAKIKTGTSQREHLHTTCRLCGGATETLAHVLAGCPSLAQSKYLERHNAALKVLFFELCKDLQLVDSVPPWYLLVAPKPVYESPEAQAYWDVPVYAEQSYVKQYQLLWMLLGSLRRDCKSTRKNSLGQ